MKVCGKCHIRKPESEFYKRKDKTKGLRSKCKQCFKDDCGERRKEERKTLSGYLRLTYNNIKHRCESPKNKHYKDYGGRGIQCKFTREEFIDYILNRLCIDPRGLDIDRIDNDGNYEPGNIRVVTHKKNMQNRRPQKGKKLSEQDVRMIIYMWRTKKFTQPEIAKTFNVKQPTISAVVNGNSFKHIWRSKKCQLV